LTDFFLGDDKKTYFAYPCDTTRIHHHLAL